MGILSAFYDLSVGMSSFAAGWASHKFGYAAAFVMAAVALVVAAIAGRRLFFARSTVVPPESKHASVAAGRS